MTAHSPRRRQILDFIRHQVATESRSPSLDEIAASCGLKSRSAAQKHVKALEASGELEVTSGKARAARPKQRKDAAPGAAPLFEVTVHDIVALNDTDLRELTARLCIAGLAEVDLPPHPVTWGGDQRAPDGGIDVRVQLHADAGAISLFPRGITGFQVKATRMAVGDIQREMCPNGLLRQSIRDIVRVRGSYIIVTSDSAADEEYRKRVNAMKAAVATETGNEEAVLDYYDARRLTDWTNQHPGVVAWVRTRLGRPLQGWQPHGQWADTRGGKPQPFLPDEKCRLADPREPERKFSLTEGLVHLRKVLRTGGSSVRLTGLSGVGKTRFAQALFESTAAPDPLPADFAVYSDSSHSPNPPPMAVLDELLASRRRAILVIDNCASQLHNQLTARCKSSDRVSLLTIEYDIREDLPNETNVFHLETGSSDLIEKVIKQQFPHVSGVNVTTITKFADGNSRVAIALANTMDWNESLAGLTDKELFDRLFWLGKEVQQELMITAQACSLVYSFDGEDLDGELAQLALLADQSVTALYRHVANLEHRGLAQRRGVWRAVLPHAVANTLAARALESIPTPLITRCLIQGSERLLRSFSRRLGYLHDSPKAATVVRTWLSAGGLLSDLTSLSPVNVDILKNVAPVDPAATLKTIERAIQGDGGATIFSSNNTCRVRLVKLIRQIAYDPEYFDRCLHVLQKFALAEEPSNSSDSTRKIIASLFFLYLSGTHAKTEQRMTWVRGALMSSDSEIESIGRDCLSAALECYHFSSHYDFEFGARKRDYGWTPHKREAQAWFASFIALSVEIGQFQTRVAEDVRDILARHFRSLWTVAGVTDALQAAAIPLLANGWEKGWLAIRQTIRYDEKGLSPAIKASLRSLEERAQPKTLEGRIKAIVLNGHSAGVDYADGEEILAGYERADAIARDLGELAATDTDTLDAVLPLVVRNKQGRQWMFGRGLAAGAHSIDACWAALMLAFESAPEEDRNIQVLRGYQHGVFEREPDTFARLLDNAMEHRSLKKWVPVLQLSAPLNGSGCTRLLRSMDDPGVPSWIFQHLGHGRTTQNLPDDTLAELLQRLSIKPEGLEVAVDILSMHILDNPNPIGPHVRRVANSLLSSFPITNKNHRMDYAFGCIVSFFLQGLQGEPTARRILVNVRNGLENYTLSKYDLSDTLKSLFNVQTKTALDVLLGDDSDVGNTYLRRRELAGGRRSSALAEVPIEILLEWCEEGDSSRFANLAPLLPAFEKKGDENGMHWSKGVLSLLSRSPHRIDVARSLVELIEPMSWMGSRSAAIMHRLPLLDELAELLGPEHSEQITIWRSNINKIVDRESRRELEEHKARNESFE